MKKASPRIWALLSLLIAASSACGSGGGGGPDNPEPECTTDADCPVSSASCEEAACVTGECRLEPKARGVTCDDGLFCTEGEVCDGRGVCGSGSSICLELLPGIPRCNEAERQCEVCTDGRPFVNGECRCPFWNCQSRGGGTYCSETDVTEENQTGCYYDGLTIDDLPPLLVPRSN